MFDVWRVATSVQEHPQITASSTCLPLFTHFTVLKTFVKSLPSLRPASYLHSWTIVGAIGLNCPAETGELVHKPGIPPRFRTAQIQILGLAKKMLSRSGNVPLKEFLSWAFLGEPQGPQKKWVLIGRPLPRITLQSKQQRINLLLTTVYFVV